MSTIGTKIKLIALREEEGEGEQQLHCTTTTTTEKRLDVRLYKLKDEVCAA